MGGVAGAAVGTILDPPPPEVRTIVIEQTTPSIVYEQPIVVGQALPTTVVLHPVPGYETYYYTVINNERVIVDRSRAWCCRSSTDAGISVWKAGSAPPFHWEALARSKAMRAEGKARASGEERPARG